MRYNLACVLIMEIGAIDEAVEIFRPFFDHVQSPMHIRHLEVDPDLNQIRDDPRFKDMLAAAKKRLGMEEQEASLAIPAQPAANA
jgi:adenylate cyclase